MSKRLLSKIAKQELQIRETATIPNVLKECLPYQLEFINDKAKRKSICSTRRSAKTFAVCIYLIHTAITTPKAKLAYLTLTNESAERIVWSKIIEVICHKYNINVHLNSKHEIEFDNNSIIYLVGLDATPKQMNRLRVNAYELVIIDECQN